MLTRDRIVNCNVPFESRFIFYAVNVRFFNIQGTNDMMVDTLGMNTLFLPDLQYHSDLSLALDDLTTIFIHHQASVLETVIARHT